MAQLFLLFVSNMNTQKICKLKCFQSVFRSWMGQRTIRKRIFLQATVYQISHVISVNFYSLFSVVISLDLGTKKKNHFDILHHTTESSGLWLPRGQVCPHPQTSSRHKWNVLLWKLFKILHKLNEEWRWKCQRQSWKKMKQNVQGTA